MSDISPEQAERLRQIYTRCVEKMKEVVREFEVTQDELHVAGDYLNRLGKSGFCRSLVDMNLALTSADITRPCVGTRGNLEGPLHRKGHPVRADGSILDRPPGPTEQKLTLTGRVLDARSGGPLSGARLDFWQTDGEGIYDRDGNHMRGVIVADQEGRYTLHTVLPKDYAEHDRDPIGELLRAMGRPNRRAGHIHVKAAVGDREVLTTQLFVAGSDYLDLDYVEGAVSDDLTIEPEATPDGDARATFDFHLDTVAR
jgi:protocatechuate 3,4-dioxygenase beta subunit